MRWPWRRHDDELDEEIRTHLAMAARAHAERGATPEDAAFAAHREFGNIGLVKETTRANWSWAWMDAVVRDARYGLRSLQRAPAVALVVVCSLAVVIGVGTSVFAVAEGLYLRRLPVPHPQQLVSVRQGDNSINVAYADFRALVAAPGVPALAGYRIESAAVLVDGERDATPEWIDLVSGGYFDLVGVPPLPGRTLTVADERAASPVAVISERFRRQHFGADVDPVGHTLKLNDLTLSIVGVMPPAFQGIHFARQFDIAAPITLSPLGFDDVSGFGVKLIGRLEPPLTLTSGAAALQAALQRCCSPSGSGDYRRRIGSGERPHAPPPRVVDASAVSPDDGPFGIGAQMFEPRRAPPVTLADASHGLRWGVDYRARYARLIVTGLAGALLLIIAGCASVATLLAARGEQREREFAIRLAIGANARQLTRQLLVEAGELAAAGGVLGVAVAILLSRWMIRVLGLAKEAGHGTLVDWRAAQLLVLPAMLVVICTILVTIWPARRAGRSNLLPSIAGGRRRGLLELSFERMLVVAQGATAVVLASTALLFVATVAELMRADGGYRSPDVLLARIEMRDAFCTGSLFGFDRCYDAEGQDRARLARFNGVIGALERVPGVSSAALTGSAPVIQDVLQMAGVHIGEKPGAPKNMRISIVGAGFFTASGLGLVAGRDFRPADDSAGAHVAIISQSLARQYYPTGSPLGRIIETDRRWGIDRVRIVGVAHDAKFDPMSGITSDLRSDVTDMVYFPLGQFGRVSPSVTVVVRTAGDPARSAPVVRGLLRKYPGIALRELVTLPRLLEQGSARERLSATLFTGAGLLSLLLVAIALFAVLQFGVQRRTREFGIRFALGARRREVLLLVLRDALVNAVAAIVLGIPVAITAHLLLRAELFGIAPGDPRVLASVAAAVILLAVSAGMVPAMRAAAVDPLDAIRLE